MQNVSLELRKEAVYIDLPDVENEAFDCVVIDGICREESVPVALRKVRENGWIYLDDTDKVHEWPEGGYQRAEAALLGAARQRGAAYEYFTGLKPATFIASQGLFVDFSVGPRAST
jgi:hypothetical protein